MTRRTWTMCGGCALTASALACSSANPASPVAPATSGPSAAADGSTLKVSAPGAVSPANDQKMTSSVVDLTASTATLQFQSAAPVALQYRFQVINDPLTDGTTKGGRHGGTFIPGQGWQSLSVTDGIDYDIAAGCYDCRLEFDATNFGGQEGLPLAKELKWVSMADPGSFSDFGAFRNTPWKMHLVQRADYPTGMEIVWRNGGTNADGGDPGDHRIKLISTPIIFSSTLVYHFKLDWGLFGYNINVNGIDVMDDS